MKKCPNCGRLYSDFVTTCSACNTSLSGNQNVVSGSNYNNNSSNNPSNNYSNSYSSNQNSVQNYSGNNSNSNTNVPAPNTNDSGSFLWVIPGLFIPIVGWILHWKWKNTKPQTAKMANIGGWIGFISGIILSNM